MLIELTQDEIESRKIVQDFKASEEGAVCVFDGIVRNHTRGRQTLFLEYAAYDSMAWQQMRALADKAVIRFRVRAVALEHRLGRLQVGETSLLIAVASAHHDGVMDACCCPIDTLKKKILIWKKEHFVDGAVWSDGEPFPEAFAVVRS